MNEKFLEEPDVPVDRAGAHHCGETGAKPARTWATPLGNPEKPLKNFDVATQQYSVYADLDPIVSFLTTRFPGCGGTYEKFALFA